MNLDDHLRTALRSQADAVEAAPAAGWEALEARAGVLRRARARRRALVAGAGALALVVGAAAVVVGEEDRDRRVVTTSPSSTTTVPEDATTTTTTTTPTTVAGVPDTTAPAVVPTTGPAPPTTAGPPSSTAAPASSRPPTSARPAPLASPYQPLWPFRTNEEVAAWQAAPAGAAWHRDPRETARRFTVDFLGFTEITKTGPATAHRRAGVLVPVGYDNPDNPQAGMSTAAVLHLVQVGQGSDRAWEVVGSEDRHLTLTTPAYGSRASSRFTVGGRITGVDESICVVARQASSAGPLGRSSCVPGGGEDTPWSVQLTVSGFTDPALVVVAHTGGHVQDVERFAITGLRR